MTLKGAAIAALTGLSAAIILVVLLVEVGF